MIYLRPGFCWDLMTLFTILASSTKKARRMLLKRMVRNWVGMEQVVHVPLLNAVTAS